MITTLWNWASLALVVLSLYAVGARSGIKFEDWQKWTPPEQLKNLDQSLPPSVTPSPESKGRVTQFLKKQQQQQKTLKN